jgi:hypothetical protein
MERKLRHQHESPASDGASPPPTWLRLAGRNRRMAQVRWQWLGLSGEGHQLGDELFEKAKFMMRTYSCRFSSFLSLGIDLTCADAGRLTDLSSIFSHRSVIFLGDRRGRPPGSGQRRSSDWSPRPSRRVVGSRGYRRAGTGTERRFRDKAAVRGIARDRASDQPVMSTVACVSFGSHRVGRAAQRVRAQPGWEREGSRAVSGHLSLRWQGCRR